MTEPAKTADSTDARQASMSRVVTSETLLANVNPEEPASEAADTTASQTQEEGTQQKAKKSPQERIVDLIERRKEAEAQAAAEKKRADEFEERLRALESSRNTPQERTEKPKRESYESDEEFFEALADWKLKERDEEQRLAQLKAEAEAIDEAFNKRMEKTKKEFDDYDEVVGSANVDIPSFLVMAIKESDIGPELVYYLSKHQDEAKRIASMRPVPAIKRLMDIERELSAEDDPVVEKPKAKPRAPEPINPLKGAPASNPAKPKSFADYKAQRSQK